jgi:hypothetical protein
MTIERGLPTRSRFRVPALVAAAVIALIGLIVLRGKYLTNSQAQPPAEDIDRRVPVHFQKASDASPVTLLDGSRAYDRLVRELPDGQTAEFLLIPQGQQDDPESFYMMKTKVTNAIFELFAREVAADPARAVPPDWENGARWDDKDLGVAGRGNYAVYRVGLDDAHRFAEWLGGDLPTVAQWDKAGGRFDGKAGTGPYLSFEGKLNQVRDTPDFALRPFGPLPVGTAVLDESPFKCRDMASNGFEWTRSEARGDVENRFVISFAAPGNEEVWLRGMSYEMAAPCRFYRVTNWPQPRKPPASDAHSLRLPQISFRVAVPLPALPKT